MSLTVRRPLAALLAVLALGLATIAGPATPAAAETARITPLDEYVKLNGVSDRTSLRFVLFRCTSLYIFSASVTKDKDRALYERYEEEGAKFLKHAKASTDQPEVMLMALQRMAGAYKTRAGSQTTDGNPLGDLFIRAELAFCADFLPKQVSALQTAPPRR